MLKFFLVGFLFFSTLFSEDLKDKSTEEVPLDLNSIGITENIGKKLDLSVELTNSEGKVIPLSNVIDGKKPILLTFVYYQCPNLCNYLLTGVTNALKKIDWTVGNQFELVVVSIDPKEEPELAKQKRATYITEYGRQIADTSWLMLTGTEESIKKLTEQAGIKFQWDTDSEQWLHPTAILVLFPDGTINRYLYGLFYDSRTVKLSLLEASNGTIASSLTEKLSLFFFRYDSTKNKYGVHIPNLIKVLGGITVLIIMIFLLLFRKEILTR